MSIDVSVFRIDFPQFENPANFSETRIVRASKRAALQINEAQWGTLYSEGLSYLTAYILSDSEIAKSSGGNSVGGMKSSSIAGEVSVTFSEQSSVNSNSKMMSNQYGAYFLELKKLTIIPVLMA